VCLIGGESFDRLHKKRATQKEGILTLAMAPNRIAQTRAESFRLSLSLIKSPGKVDKMAGRSDPNSGVSRWQLEKHLAAIASMR
jgi:hypothetical protein